MSEGSSAVSDTQKLDHPPNSRQTTLLEFLGKRALPKYFRLTTTASSSILEPSLCFTASFTDIPISNKTFTSHPFFRSIKESVIVDTAIEFPLFTPYSGFYTEIYNVAYLKSHLQKCIRRGLTELALSTAYSLLLIDPISFLRRIIVIQIEDAYASSFLPFLTWLLLACSNGFDILPFISAILGVTKAICEMEINDRLEDLKVLEENERQLCFKILKEENLEGWCKDILYAILLRQEFGGMKGDMLLLKDCTRTLFFRFIHSSINHTPFKTTYVNVDSISPLLKSNFLWKAIDFHVAPILPSLIQLYPTFDAKILKKVIWNKSSGVNVRQKAFGWENNHWILSFNEPTLHLTVDKNEYVKEKEWEDSIWEIINLDFKHLALNLLEMNCIAES